MKRRTFLGLSTLALPAILSAQSPSRKLRIAIVGMGSRGTSHAVTFSKHLGNSVYRTGDAKRLWKRVYRAGWEPVV